MNDGDTCESGVSCKDVELKPFIGTKILLAKPMHENEWAKENNQESGGREGYVVVYDNNYRSWSPKDVFETHYRLITNTEKQTVNF